jgi:hypothetical protein
MPTNTIQPSQTPVILLADRECAGSHDPALNHIAQSVRGNDVHVVAPASPLARRTLAGDWRAGPERWRRTPRASTARSATRPAPGACRRAARTRRRRGAAVGERLDGFAQGAVSDCRPPRVARPLVDHTRPGCVGAKLPRPAQAVGCPRAAVNPGRSKLIVVPSPSTDSARMRPPCASTIARAIANPRPLPPRSRERLCSAR